MKYFILLPLFAPILASAIDIKNAPYLADPDLASPDLTPRDIAADANLPPTDDGTIYARSIDDGVSSDLTITAWSDSRCTHDSNTWRGKYYGKNETWPGGFRSYKLSRDLQPKEQLDFSTSQPSADAGVNGLNGETKMDASKKPDFCKVLTKKCLAPADRAGGKCRGVGQSSQCVNLYKE